MTKKILLLDAASGISGDMSVAALLDLGADRAPLDALFASLPLDGSHVHISRVKKAGLDCCDFDVHLDHHHENHDHDMEYLHGHSHAAPSSGAHDQSHDGHAHPHVHRGLREIEAILDAATMADEARTLAKRIFRILAEAESKAHGIPPTEVHFHEVGAIDSILDIAAFSVLFTSLGVDGVWIPRLAEGRGTVRCQHGVLPIPVPAVARIAEAYALPLEATEVEGELVTPTGAAIAAAIRTESAPPRTYRILASGLGAGKRDYACAGFLRAMLVEPAPSDSRTPVPSDSPTSVCALECNLDDMTGEELGFALERLLGAGARDAFYAPVFMKKNRPGWLLTVLCAPDEADRFTALLFRHTTTLGVRRTLHARTVLPRSFRTVPTPWGDVPVKEAGEGDNLRLHPEYDAIARIAREHNLPLRTVSQAALSSLPR